MLCVCTAVCCCCVANVFRDGQRITLDADQLVPGDVVAIKSGDRLPADMRLLQVANLQVCCAALQGKCAAGIVRAHIRWQHAASCCLRQLACSVRGVQHGLVVSTLHEFCCCHQNPAVFV